MFAFRFFVGLIMILAARAAFGGVITFSDIQTWAGTGSNEAALVVDWNDGKDPLAWGFRWDGVATGEDMFRAIVLADDRFYGRIQEFGFGTLVNGIGYDRDKDGFGIDDGGGLKPLGAGGLFVGAEASYGIADDVVDSYAESNNSTFEYWEYFNGVGNPYSGGSWASSLSGFTDRSLTDGDWDGWYYPGTFGGAPLAVPGMAQAAGTAAVPEPGTMGLLSFLAIGGLVRRARRKRLEC